MYKILPLLVLMLAGCSPQRHQYDSLYRAFIQGCVSSTIESSLVNDGDKLILAAKCTKDK